jgi:hypothetical protein
LHLAHRADTQHLHHDRSLQIWTTVGYGGDQQTPSTGTVDDGVGLRSHTARVKVLDGSDEIRKRVLFGKKAPV